MSSFKLPGGIEGTGAAAAQIESTPLEPAPGLPAPTTSAPIPDPLTAQLEEEARTSLATVHGLDVQLAWVLRAYALTTIQRNHEVSYRLMFGSQIAALKAMNENAGRKTIDEMRKVYDAAVERWPEEYADYGFEQWLNYLTGRGYITISPFGLAEMTRLGQNFLLWMVEQGVTERKLL